MRGTRVGGRRARATGYLLARGLGPAGRVVSAGFSRAVGLAIPLLLLAGADPAAACGSCYGQADGPMIDAARLGIWLLLAVTFGVQGGFVAFFIHLKRRAARAKDEALDEEWARLQREWDGREGGERT